jgi:hypothetical protein
MTRRIDRAMALLRRGDRSVTETCFPVGWASVGGLSSRISELVGMPRRLSAPGGAGDGGEVVVRGEPGDQIRSGIEKRRPRTAANVTAMDITIHASFLPHDDPSAAGQAHSYTSFIAGGRLSNGRSEHEASAQEEAMAQR